MAGMFMFLTILVVFFNNNESVCGSLPQQGGLADSHFIGRQKRSWSPLQQALRMILKGTQRQPFTSSNELIVYNKQATFHDAVQDFYSLEPAYVRQNPHGALVGNVGDVDVFLRGPDKERNLIATLVVPGGQHVKRMGFTGPSQFKTTRVIHYVSEY